MCVSVQGCGMWNVVTKYFEASDAICACTEAKAVIVYFPPPGCLPSRDKSLSVEPTARSPFLKLKWESMCRKIITLALHE